MHHDPDLLGATVLAFLLFGGIAVFFPVLLARITRGRRVKLPHPVLILVFRLWFALLAAGALSLMIFGRQGLYPR